MLVGVQWRYCCFLMTRIRIRQRKEEDSEEYSALERFLDWLVKCTFSIA
jgi:hypothetical protein